jgi:penicillin V acylase-like amidase (Ntn superfamily)
MERCCGAGRRLRAWASRSDSVVSSTWNVATAEGVNDMGLTTDMLDLAVARYADPSSPRRPSAFRMNLAGEFAVPGLSDITQIAPMAA